MLAYHVGRVFILVHGSDFSSFFPLKRQVQVWIRPAFQLTSTGSAGVSVVNVSLQIPYSDGFPLLQQSLVRKSRITGRRPMAQDDQSQKIRCRWMPSRNGALRALLT